MKQNLLIILRGGRRRAGNIFGYYIIEGKGEIVGLMICFSELLFTKNRRGDYLKSS